MKTVLTIRGMSCGHCARRVREALLKLPGLDSVQVDQPSGTATIEGAVPEPATLRTAVEEAGYELASIGSAT